MIPKRLLLLIACILLSFLGLYSWNQRTSALDRVATATGLEVAGTVLKAIHGAQDTVTGIWKKYIHLVDVQAENEQLKAENERLRALLTLAAEDNAELTRLRELLRLPPPEGWQTLGCRVLGRRMGPSSPLIAVTISRGYLTGAEPQTPAVTPDGVAGVVYRAGPYTATVLLLTDPGMRISVISQKSRTQGILAGTGGFRPLEMLFVPHNAGLENGELLVTSGLDGVFPKGVPIARLTSITPSSQTSFLSVWAEPLADLSKLEDLLLLVRMPGTSWAGLIDPPASAAAQAGAELATDVDASASRQP